MNQCLQWGEQMRQDWLRTESGQASRSHGVRSLSYLPNNNHKNNKDKNNNNNNDDNGINRPLSRCQRKNIGRQ